MTLSPGAFWRGVRRRTTGRSRASTRSRPTNQQPTVPVLAVTRVGGQSFVYVATPKGNGYVAHQTLVNLSEPVGNIYPVISGLKTGDRVILSGTQFLFEGAPVQPLAPQPTAAPANPPS